MSVPPGFLLSNSWAHLSLLKEANSLGLNKLLNLLCPNLCLPALPLGSSVDILATDDPDFAQDDQQDTRIYEKHDNLLHGTKKKK